MKLARVLLWLACALVVLALLAGGGYGLLFYRPPPPPAPVLPIPNGYDDLVRGGSMVTAPEKDLEKMGAEDLRAYLSRNQNALEAVRLGLLRESRVPLTYTEEFAANTAQLTLLVTPMRHLFEAEGMLAEKEERPSEAIRSYLDWFRVGVKGIRGGLLVHRIVGGACQSGALRRLQRLEAGLGAVEYRLAIHGLERAASEEEPVEEFLKREEAWWRTLSSWSELALSRVLNGDVLGQFEHSFRISIARQRLLLADLAIRAHRLEKGAPPRTLADLVPQFLSSIPEDPFARRPLLYRADGSNYRLYSVSPDGRDDGGLLVPEKDLEVKGDYFLETDLLPAPLDP